MTYMSGQEEWLACSYPQNCMHAWCDVAAGRGSEQNAEHVQLAPNRHLRCRQLPAELAAASQLTWLRLRDPQADQLSVAPNSLPCSLQRLRLAYDDVTDLLDETLQSIYDEAALPTLPRDFASLHHLQHLQLTVHGWGVHRLPST